MTRDQAKARLSQLHDRRARRDLITEAEWDEIDICEDFLAATAAKRRPGYYPACFATANMNEI